MKHDERNGERKLKESEESNVTENNEVTQMREEMSTMHSENNEVIQDLVSADAKIDKLGIEAHSDQLNRTNGCKDHRRISCTREGRGAR